MLSFKTTLQTQQAPQIVWDILHSTSETAILFGQRIRATTTYNDLVNRTGYQARHDLMDTDHNPTFNVLETILAQEPYKLLRKQYFLPGATWNLTYAWRPASEGSTIEIQLETNYSSPFTTLGMLFSKRKYMTAFEQRFQALRQYLDNYVPQYSFN